MLRFLRHPHTYVAAGILAASLLALTQVALTTTREDALTENRVFRAKVVEVVSEQPTTNIFNRTMPLEQTLAVEFKDLLGETRRVTVVNDYTSVGVGDRVVIQGSLVGQEDESFSIIDIERTSGLWMLALLFVAISWTVGRQKSLYAIVGLVFSLAVVIFLLIPLLLAGFDAILIGLACSGLILLVTLYLSHGLNKKSLAALAGILVTLAIVGVLGHLSVTELHFTGFGGEEAVYLVQETEGTVDLVGLLIAGILIAAIGVLDDVAVTQVSLVSNLRQINPSLKGRALFRKAMEVGQDHISAVINTLVMAYVGAGLPLLLLLTLQKFPADLVIGGENMAEEVIRTLVSTIGLVLAVPITTLIAIWIHEHGQKVSVDK